MIILRDCLHEKKCSTQHDDEIACHRAEWSSLFVRWIAEAQDLCSNSPTCDVDATHVTKLKNIRVVIWIKSIHFVSPTLSSVRLPTDSLNEVG